MKKLILITSLFGVIVTLNSCHKNEASKADITIYEHTANDTVAFNDSVHFEGAILGDGELHGYTLSYTNSTTGASLFSVTAETHATSYAFHEHWLNNLTDTTVVNVKVEVEINHDGDLVSKEVNFVCLPQ
jgi:hypothetical protein